MESSDGSSAAEGPAAAGVADAPPPALTLAELPRTVLAAVLEAVIEASSPASVVALALVSRAGLVRSGVG
jgi:hypothetical protein